MKEYTTKRSVSGLAALLLLGVFGASVLLVLLTGANVYRTVTQRDQRSYDRRTCTQFVATSVRQASSGRAVRVERFGDSDALVIERDVQGEPYLTRIYCHDGWLMQLFAAQADTFAPEDGESILPAEEMTVRRDGDLLQITFRLDGETSQMSLYLPGGEGAAE